MTFQGTKDPRVHLRSAWFRGQSGFGASLMTFLRSNCPFTVFLFLIIPENCAAASLYLRLENANSLKKGFELEGHIFVRRAIWKFSFDSAHDHQTTLEQ